MHRNFFTSSLVDKERFTFKCKCAGELVRNRKASRFLIIIATKKLDHRRCTSKSILHFAGHCLTILDKGVSILTTSNSFSRSFLRKVSNLQSIKIQTCTIEVIRSKCTTSRSRMGASTTTNILLTCFQLIQAGVHNRNYAEAIHQVFECSHIFYLIINLFQLRHLLY